MVHTFQNVNFEIGSIDPMNPPYWTASYNYTVEEIAAFNSSLGFPASAVESFELGYTQGIATAPFPQWNWSFPEEIVYKINGGATLNFIPTALAVSSVASFVNVVNATAVGLTAYACGDTVYIQAEDTTDGATLEILSSTTFTSLGLTPGVYLQEDNSFFLYSFSSLDTAASSFSSGIYLSEVEGFEAQWSSLSAEFVTPLAEDFVFTGVETLELTVDDLTGAAPPTYTVNFSGTKTAQEIADAINTVSSPVVVASALESGQVRISNPGIYKKALKVGGTSLATFGLDGISPNPVVVDGAEDYTDELNAAASAQFGTNLGTSPQEDFESLWPDNENYMYMFTIRTLTYTQVAPNQDYTATVNGTTVSYTSLLGDTPSDVATEISTKIDNLDGFSSSPSAGEVTIVPDDERNRVEYSATEPLNSDVVVGTQRFNLAKIFPAAFSTTQVSPLQPEEDFESLWLNNQDDIRLFSDTTVRINTVVSNREYTVTIGEETFTYLHGTTGPPSAFSSIAAGLAGLINGYVTPNGATVTATNTTPGSLLYGEVTITVTPANETLDITAQGPVDDTTMTVILEDTSGLIDRAIFGGLAPQDEEQFTGPTNPLIPSGGIQVVIEFNVATTGLYSFVAYGQTFFVNNNGGTLTPTDIRDSFVSQINAGSIEIDAFSAGVDIMSLRSARIPPVDLEFSLDTPNPLDVTIDLADKQTGWTYTGALTSPI
jgi:hypothetical protein